MGVPGWYGDLIPRTNESMRQTLSPEFLEVMDDPLYAMPKRSIGYKYNATRATQSPSTSPSASPSTSPSASSSTSPSKSPSKSSGVATQRNSRIAFPFLGLSLIYTIFIA